MFKKGDPRINRKGRKPGSLDKKWATLEYWFIELDKDLNDSSLPITDKAKIKAKMIELLMSRLPLPPTTPEASVTNADALLKRLNEINGRTNPDQTNPMENGSK